MVDANQNMSMKCHYEINCEHPCYHSLYLISIATDTFRHMHTHTRMHAQCAHTPTSTWSFRKILNSNTMDVYSNSNFKTNFSKGIKCIINKKSNVLLLKMFYVSARKRFGRFYGNNTWFKWLCFILHRYSWSQIYVWAIWVGHDQTFFGDSDLEIQYEYHSTVNDFVPSMWQKKQEVKNKNIKYKKPSHPCPFCCTAQAQLKCHILTKYNTEPFVIPILTMNPSNENHHIDMLRQQAIRNHMALLKAGEKSFICESKPAGQHEDLPLMCSGWEGSWPENSRLVTNLFVQLLVLN